MAEAREPRVGERRELRSSGRPRRSRPPTLKGPQLAGLARDQLAQITGYEAQGVSELRRNEDGGWTATVELLEMSRIPPSDDLLASYRAEFDESGELLGYERVSRYARGRVGTKSEREGG
jgi:Gas vesicle synthesis protein GvpO